MVVTQHAQSEISKGLSLRDSSDPDKRSQYWDVGLQYVQNSLDDLRTADKNDQSAYNKVESRRYVPAFDAIAYLNAEARKSDLKIEFDKNGDGYFTSETNGEASIPNFKEWANVTLSTNPAFRDAQMALGNVSYENKEKAIMQSAASRGITLDRNQVRHQIAEEVYNDQMGNLTKQKESIDSTLEEIDGQLKSYMSASINMVPDPNNPGQMIPDPSDPNYAKFQQLQAKKEGYKKWQDAATAKIQDLQNHKGNLEEKVFNNGSGYFAEQYANTVIGNWASTYAKTHYKKEVKADASWNQARNRELQWSTAKLDSNTKLEVAKLNNETALEKEGMKQAGKAVGRNSAGQTVDAKGNVITDQGTIVGVDAYNQQHIDPYQAQIQQVQTLKTQGGFKYSEGVKDMLPLANISVGGKVMDTANTTALINQLNYLDQNGYKGFNTKYGQSGSKSILGQTVDLLKSKGYSVSYSNPQEIREALSSYVQKTIKGLHLTPEQQQQYNRGRASVVEGNSIMDDAYSKLNDTNAKVQQYAQSAEAKQKYGNILVEDGKGGKEVVTVDKLAKKFKDIGEIDFKTGKLHMQVSAKELAEAYSNGTLAVYNQQNNNPRIVVGDKTIKLTAGNNLDVLNSILPVIRELGYSKDFAEKKKAFESEAFKNTIFDTPDGNTAQVVNYKTGTKNPQNNAKVNAILTNFNGNTTGGFVDAKGTPLDKNGDFNKIISSLSTSDIESFNYGNGRTGYFTFNPTALKRLSKEFDPEEIAQLNSGQIRFTINENTTADALQDLPVPQRAAVDTRLLNGQSVTQTKEQEQEGFKFSIIPDNAGGKGIPNSVQIVVQTGKKDASGNIEWDKEMNIGGSFNLSQYPYQNLRDMINQKYKQFLDLGIQNQTQSNQTGVKMKISDFLAKVKK